MSGQKLHHEHLCFSEECDKLRAKALDRLTRSGVVEQKSGGSEVSDIRTSDGMFFSRAEDPLIEGELSTHHMLPAV